MSAYNVLARHVMAPAADLIRGCHCMASLVELEASQWWSRERIESLQADRLAQTIKYAYAHVPYYRRVMQERGMQPGDVRTVADLARLPVLTKDIVRSQMRTLLSDDVAPRDLMRSQTAGSTGSPLVFLASKRDRYSYGYARGLLVDEWAGVALGDRVTRFVQHQAPAPTRLDSGIRQISARLRRETRVPLASLSDENLDSAVRLLNLTKPKAIGAYPSTLALLARHIRDFGCSVPALHAVLTGGEQVFENQRALVREVFGVEPYSMYGASETYLLAAECEAHTGMHVFAQDIVLEIVDDDGSPVALGREGRVLVTSLHARAMPFIRYDIGDMGSYALAPCPCGRGMPLLDRLSGRRCDTIYTRSGGRIIGNGVERDGFASLGVTELQYVQEDLDHLTARFVVPEALTAQSQAAFRRQAIGMLRRSLGPEITVMVELVDQIERTPAGKYVPVISKVDPDSWLHMPPA